MSTIAAKLGVPQDRVTYIEGLLRGEPSIERRPVTQTELLRSLAESSHVSTMQARRFVDALSSTAIREVKRAGEFVLPGLGKLVRVDRKARMGRNPATGEAIKIPCKKVVKFRVAKAAKDAILEPRVK